MKREISNIDFDLLQECCQELDIELIPADLNKYVVLINENGDKEYLDSSFSIFDNIDTETSIKVPYSIKHSNFVKSQNIQIINEYKNTFEYSNQVYLKYKTEKNSYKGQNVYAA